jgi:pimeloyl-ACP methyl ester carboxylesterase
MSNSSPSPARSKAIPRSSFHTVEADGVRIFYREAGPAGAPVLLLLHGYPSSSHMFRELIPRMATRYRVIAPDLPGFGFTVVPGERNYKYSFAGLASTMVAFVDAVGLQRYALYVFDYGAPVGFRLALLTRNVSLRLFRRTATPMKRVWAMHGVQSAATGPNLHLRTVKQFGVRC